MAAKMAASTPPPSIRSWRTAFLTLRDETLTTPPRTSLPDLLHSLIFSNSSTLTSAALDLPSHEVTSDLLFLIELVGNVHQVPDSAVSVYSQSFHLIQDVVRHVSLDINASSWKRILDSFGKIIEALIGKGCIPEVASANSATIRPLIDCFETLRRFVSTHRISSISENVELVMFLCQHIASIHSRVYCCSQSGNRSYGALAEKRLPRTSNLWEVQSLAFSMLGEAFSRVGSSIPANIWQSVIEVLRKEMDVLASRSLLVEDSPMPKFYASLLQCLHLVLSDVKCSPSEHVPSFVVTLRLFFTYGLGSCRPQLARTVVSQKEKEVNLLNSTPRSTENETLEPKKYKPPHLRKKETVNARKMKNSGARTLSDQVSSTEDHLSSDSDYSDSDNSIRHTDSIRRSKVRVAALQCVQDLCQADPKAFTTQWTMLLPTNDVLESRNFDATLMTCLFFDPYLKARIASASTLAVMLDGPSSVSLQVAEYRDSSKRGSFTSLSSSLGQILWQLHKGIIYLIMRETHSGLLASLLKILMLLISSTPYARMPEDLLPTVISSLQGKLEEGFQSNNDRTSLLAVTISCLTAALSTTPSSGRVQEMLTEEISQGFVNTGRKSGVLFTLFGHAEQLTNLTISFEALQALRTLSHTYPKVMLGCWKQVFSIVYKYLEAASPGVPRGPHRGSSGNTAGVIGEKVTTAAIKVLDDCLRAVSGFKGTEDLFDEKLLDTPFTSDCIRTKKISSAPFYGNEEDAHDSKEDPGTSYSGGNQWNEAIEEYLPLTIWNTSSMVRTASVTCFAGITSLVFFSLSKQHQDFILSSTIHAAVEDKVPSVRSAACRAIGVIICFPDISQSAEILGKFIRAVEINTHDSLVAVRITASWALANICDSLRYYFDEVHPEYFFGSEIDAQLVTLLVECALRLTNDSDKIKSNAVRALGSLSRYVICGKLPKVHEKPVESTGSPSRRCVGVTLSTDRWIGQNPLESCNLASALGPDWLERIVQAFLSCVTTGNVKVQWNVCYAFSNLFRNGTLRLKDKDWAPSVFSILLLLLRDSANFKIRIQAAAALAVPETAFDYGRSFTDVVKGLEHVLENLDSYQISAPSSFKYRATLEKQLTTTMLHVLSLLSSTDHQPLKDFLMKKASFYEEWLSALCLSIKDSQSEAENVGAWNQKKEIISKALRSLREVFDTRNCHATADRFETLYQMIQQ